MNNFKVGDRVTAEYMGRTYDGVVSGVVDDRGVKTFYVADPTTKLDILLAGEDWGVPLTLRPPPPPPKPRRYYPSSIAHTRRS